MSDVQGTDRSAEEQGRRLSNRLLWAFLGAVLVGNAFLLEPLLGDGGMAAQFSALAGLVLLLVPMVRLVIADLRSGRVRMNELAILAVLACASRGDIKTAGVIAFIMLISLIIESRTASGASAALEALAGLSPGRARRLQDDGSEAFVDPALLQPGDLLRVRPGETVLADGRIVRGATSLQEASITGESLPVDKGVGDGVFSGTVNLTGSLDVQVTRAGEDTTLGKVRQLILAAEQTRLPVVRLIDRYVHYYTPIVLIVAAMVWFFTGDVDRLVSLFIVSCPVALFLATPSAMVAALSAAARVGILIKNVSDLELAARLDAFVFDKTGTLTSGELSVARLAPVAGVESATLLQVVGSAEQHSNHPVAQAVTALARRARVSLVAPEDLHEEPGRGIRAAVEGRRVVVGNRAWVEANGVGVDAFPEAGDAAAGMSVLYALCDGLPLGWIGLKDEPRDESAEALAQLRERGIGQIALITGDRADVAERIAEELEIPDWRGDCVPADKVAYVRDVRAQGRRVAFVGDGVNDGPALAVSHVGIALGAAGSDVALESASIALMNNDLRRLPFLVDLARASRRTVIGNFLLGGVVVGGGAFLSGLGALSPVLAAVFQVCGAVGVVMNSARLIRQGEQFD